MKINKKLLPIKAQFFFGNAGAAPIIPFIPVMIRELGYSAVVFGWIYTVSPVITCILKPVVGSIVDKFKCQKSALLTILIVQTIACFSLQWTPALPTDNSVKLGCSHNITIETCSDKLKEKCYADKILESILNSTHLCKINLFSGSYLVDHHLNDKKTTTKLTEELSVELVRGSVESDCLTLYMKNETHIYSKWLSACDSANETAELYCENSSLDQLIRKATVDDNEVTLTSQFWIVFITITFIRCLMSVGVSLVDTICFASLGDQPENYGKQRMWGAVGWGLMSIIAGIIADYMSKGKTKIDYSVSFYIMLVFSIISILIMASFKVKQANTSGSIGKDVRNLFKNSKICIFIVWCVIGGIYSAFVSNFLFWFIEDLGSKDGCSSKPWIKTLEGLVLSVHTYCGEIPFFFISGTIMKKIGHIHSMTLVLFVFGIRFLLYSSLSDVWWILPIESLNGITFGVLYATMTTYASVISPPGTETTIQNIVTAAFEGVGVALGGVLGGYLFKVLGSSQTFFLVGLSAITFGFLHIIAHLVTKDAQPEFYSSVRMKAQNAKGTDEDKVAMKAQNGKETDEDKENSV